MAKKIIFLKMSLQDAIKNGAVNVAVPMASDDLDIFNKLKTPFKATVTNPRNIMHHRKYFAIMGLMVDNGILDKLPIKDEVVNSLKTRFKDDVYTLVYILKYLYLPLDIELLPTGQTIERVASISFSEMDQDKFKEFYDNSVNYCCDVIGITKEQLEMNIV